MALCAGAILAYPETWGARFRAAALGLLAITLLNVVRIGHLSLVAADNSLFQLLHIYVWPGILILATAAYQSWTMLLRPGVCWSAAWRA